MQNDTDFWAFVLIGTPGFIAAIVQLIQLINSRRKLKSDTYKTDAETSKIQGETYRDLLDELRDQIDELRTQMDELKTRQHYYEKYIDMLVAQLKEHGVEPAKRPIEIDD